MPEVNGIHVPFVPLKTAEDFVDKKVRDFGNDFDAIFKKELEKIKFSGHALKRLEARNIELSNEEIDKIQTAVEKAEMKGAKDSLVMVNNKAFIVNIPNHTVITAMLVEEDGDNVFTNIDSVVLT